METNHGPPKEILCYSDVRFCERKLQLSIVSISPQRTYLATHKSLSH